jgi:hypothetical protein
VTRQKRNVADVPYVETADLAKQTPMREVLAERKRRAASSPKKLREAAYAARAAIIARLGSCICTWPLERFETESEHADWCVAHAMFLSEQEANRRKKAP